MTERDEAEKRRDEQEVRLHDQETRQQGAADKGHRDAIYLAFLVVILFGISIFWSSHTAKEAAAGRAEIQQAAIDAQEKAITAACDFWYPLTSLPVTTLSGQTKPTKLSVDIIGGARESYAGQCENDGKPPLPPPDPSFAHWATVYHVPVTP